MWSLSREKDKDGQNYRLGILFVLGKTGHNTECTFDRCAKMPFSGRFSQKRLSLVTKSKSSTEQVFYLHLILIGIK